MWGGEYVSCPLIYIPLAIGAAAAAKIVVDTLVGTDKKGPDDERRLTFYHGTDVASALRLLNGAPISADEAVARHRGGPGGPAFYLATDPATALHFAAGRIEGGAMLKYTMTEKALTALLNAGATLQSVPPMQKGRGQFPGTELRIPPSAMETFNQLQKMGEITVEPYDPNSPDDPPSPEKRN